MMYRTSNTTQKTARAKIKTPYIKNASWLVIISGNKVFGSAELSGVDSGSGLVEFFSGSAMVDALRAFKKSCVIVCLQMTFKSKRPLSFRGKQRANLSEFVSNYESHEAKSTDRKAFLIQCSVLLASKFISLPFPQEKPV